MDQTAQDVVRAASEGSDQERLTFPEVVAALMAAGVERYQADLVTDTKTFYMPDGTFTVVPSRRTGAVATAFSAAGVEAAVRAIQARTIGYREFCTRIAAAGCVGYTVSLVGRRAIYAGRTGDSHTEWFPGAR